MVLPLEVVLFTLTVTATHMVTGEKITYTRTVYDCQRTIKMMTERKNRIYTYRFKCGRVK